MAKKINAATIKNKMVTEIATFEELKYVLKNKKLRETHAFMKVAFTPKNAKEIIKSYLAENRKLSIHVTRDYRNAFLNGRWVAEAPETLGFDKEGKLFDGNHRIHAIADCEDENMIVILNVAIGCNKNPYTDTGRHRTPNDNLRCMGYLPKGKEEFFKDPILKAIGTIGNLSGVRSKVENMNYQQSVIDNNTNLIVDFQKEINIEDKSMKEFRRIPILAATLNLYAQNVINAKDVAHIAYVLHNIYSAENGTTTRDLPLLSLAKVSKDYKGGGEAIKKNLFVLTDKAIRAYVKGTKGSDIRKPQEKTTLEIPTIYDLSISKETNTNNIVKVRKTKKTKKVAV